VHVGLLIYGSLDTVSGGFIYDRNLVRYLRQAGDRVEVISLPWHRYGVSLLDNLNPGLRRRLTQAAFDVLLEDELVHPACSGSTSACAAHELPGNRHRASPALRERHPALMRRLYRGWKTLPGLGGRLHLRQPHHRQGRGGFGGADAPPGGGLSRPRRPARGNQPAEISARTTAPGILTSSLWAT